MKKFDIGVKGVFVNYFTVEAEDEESATSVALDLFWSDTGDCIESDIVEVEELDDED